MEVQFHLDLPMANQLFIYGLGLEGFKEKPVFMLRKCLVEYN